MSVGDGASARSYRSQLQRLLPARVRGALTAGGIQDCDLLCRQAPAQGARVLPRLASILGARDGQGPLAHDPIQGHLDRGLLVVGQMELREFYAAYREDGWGAAAYDPSHV